MRPSNLPLRDFPRARSSCWWKLGSLGGLSHSFSKYLFTFFFFGTRLDDLDLVLNWRVTQYTIMLGKMKKLDTCIKSVWRWHSPTSLSCKVCWTTWSAFSVSSASSHCLLWPSLLLPWRCSSWSQEVLMGRHWTWAAVLWWFSRAGTENDPSRASANNYLVRKAVEF